MDTIEGESTDEWFTREILSLEPMIMHVLRQNWRNEAEIDDLRQEVYVRAYAAALRCRPVIAEPFVFQIIRNLLIDRQRRNKVIHIGSLTDLEELALASDEASPEENVAVHQEIDRLQTAMDGLSQRCRQVVVLRKIYGMAQRDVARYMGISEKTVEQHLAKGIRILSQSISARRGAVVSRAKRYLEVARPAMS